LRQLNNKNNKTQHARFMRAFYCLLFSFESRCLFHRLVTIAKNAGDANITTPAFLLNLQKNLKTRLKASGY
jgi:hypothetical protein